jgi:hypothetical protein
MADSSLDRAYTAGLTIIRVPTAKMKRSVRPKSAEVRRWFSQVLAIVIYCGLIFGALVLPIILHDWILIETGRTDIADTVSYIVFGAFTVSLGVASGVYNFLRSFPRRDPELAPASHRTARRAIKHAKV